MQEKIEQKKIRSAKTALGLYLRGEHKYNTDQNFKNKVNYTRAYVKNKIKDNVILYETVHGASMTGNPYALFRQLFELEKHNFIHVWVTKKDQSFDTKGYEHYDNVKFVARDSKEYMHFLTGAKYLINDSTFPSYFIKKEGQIYLNTWHGTPLKTMGKDMKGVPSEGKNVQRNFLQADYLIAPNLYTRDILTNAYDIAGIYPGKVIEEGYPRMDALFHTDKDSFIQALLSKSIKVDPEKKIVLYAPTWRGTMGTEMDVSTDLEKTVKVILETLPETHQLLLKIHPFAYKFLNNVPEVQEICVPIDVDANELLSIVDILVTDYSSIFFDFYVMQKPIILFAYDYNEYIAHRGVYLQLDQLDVNVAYNTNDFIALLLEAIKSKKSTQYQDAIQKYCYKNLDGNATTRYIDIIFNRNESEYNVYSVQNTKKNIIAYGAGMLNNGISSSLVNLSNTIDYNKFNLIVIDKDKLNNENIKYLEKLHHKTKVFYRESQVPLTIREWVFYTYSLRRYNEKYVKRFNIQKLYQREFKRLFGNLKVDVVIEYSGYSTFWTQLFAYSNAKKKIIYLHNDMWEQSLKIVNNRQAHKTRFSIIFPLYDKFDVLACVGKKTMEVNKRKLHGFFAKNKICHIPNSLAAETIKQKAESLEYTDVKIADKNYLVNVNASTQLIFGLPAPREGSIMFITIGRLSPEKDYAKLIESFRKLVNDKPEYQMKFQLYIIGKGELLAELQQKVTEYGLRDNIILTGHLDNPFPLMAKSNCYISSSNHEGQPMVLLEALVLNKDIIATNIEGNVSVLGNKYGHLVDNSVDGLYGGIIDYLENKLEKKEHFNIEAYEKKAKKAFEQMCLEDISGTWSRRGVA